MLFKDLYFFFKKREFIVSHAINFKFFKNFSSDLWSVSPGGSQEVRVWHIKIWWVLSLTLLGWDLKIKNRPLHPFSYNVINLAFFDGTYYVPSKKLVEGGGQNASRGDNILFSPPLANLTLRPWLWSICTSWNIKHGIFSEDLISKQAVHRTHQVRFFSCDLLGE